MCAKSLHMSASLGVAASMTLTLLLVSIDSTFAEESILISQNNAAAPPESVEARIKLRQHREASALNRFTFSGNILENVGDIVEHWFVMFCPGWHEKCQSLLPSYELLGVQWEDKLNTALMSSKVRFAKVDCATEKALCITLGIDDYPSVVHYRQQQHVNAWFGGAPGLVRWVKEELQPPKRRKSQKVEPRVSEQSKMEQILETTADEANKQPSGQSTCTAGSLAMSLEGGSRALRHILRASCFVALLVAVICCLWKYVSLRNRGQEVVANSESSEGCLKEHADAMPATAQSILL